MIYLDGGRFIRSFNIWRAEKRFVRRRMKVGLSGKRQIQAIGETGSHDNSATRCFPI